jgi:predicted phage terminase large subunit-like protein
VSLLVKKRLDPVKLLNHVSLSDIDRVLCTRRLSEFVKKAWPIIEPGTPLVWGWHIEAICEHLEAVSRGEILRLLVNMPPRHMKSSIISVMWPAWEWTFKPETRWLCASYAAQLSIRDSVACRRLIESAWYQSLFSEAFTLTSDQNTKGRFENDRRGYRLSASVDGAATGEGGDRIVVDDPHNVKDTDSPTKREAVIRWWSKTMATRLNDPKRSAKVVVMQRIHEKDLSAHIVEEETHEEWEHLCLPARFEPSHPVRSPEEPTKLGWKDPRSDEGELLWPERFDEEAQAKIEKSLGTYGAAGQMQQRPHPEGGGIVKRHWFGIVEDYPRSFNRILRYWDLAGTEANAKNDPDWTSGAKGVFVEGVLYVLHIARDRVSAKAVDDLVKNTAHSDGITCEVFIEQEPGSSGKKVIDTFQRTILPGFTVKADRPTGPKMQRWRGFIAAAEAGNVKFLAGEWNGPVLDVLEAIPTGAHDDDADAIAGLYNMITAEDFWFV